MIAISCVVFLVCSSSSPHAWNSNGTHPGALNPLGIVDVDIGARYFPTTQGVPNTSPVFLVLPLAFECMTLNRERPAYTSMLLLLVRMNV
jgi:hypothetical protein